MVELSLAKKEKATFLDAAVLAGQWYVNNQCTDEKPWGDVFNSADLGRFIYEYYPTTTYSRGMGSWGTAVAIFGLLSLEKEKGKVKQQKKGYKEAAELAGGYLKTLQVMDKRDRRVYGAIREHRPQDAWGFMRDMATGAMGFVALYRETGKDEWLERAKIFADWWLNNARDEEGWPYYNFHFEAEPRGDKGPAGGKGPWQAGAGLFLYYLYNVTGDERYINDGLKPLMDNLVSAFHVEGYGTNDDFCTITLIGAYRLLEDKKYLERIKRQVEWLRTVQEEDGSYQGHAGHAVASLTMLDFCELVDEKNLEIDTKPYYESVYKSAKFGLTLQERELRNLRAYGGFYGQSPFHVNRDRIHSRVTGYSLILYLRLGGEKPVPYYSTSNWQTYINAFSLGQEHL